MGIVELSGKPDEMLGGNLAMDQYPIQGGVVILLIASAMETGLIATCLKYRHYPLPLSGPVRVLILVGIMEVL